MRVLLIRHCKTKFNVSGHIMGWSDSPHVENWLEDVQFIEHELAQRNLLPDLVYTSALGRARHTGDYLAGQFGRTARHSQQLNEVDYGELAEKPKKWVSANFPLHKVDPDFTYPGGESFSGMQSRAVACLDGLAAAHPDETLLCVAHAGVIRGLVSHYLHLDFCDQLKRKIPHRYIGVLNLEHSICQAYEEWGDASGFVTERAITLPCHPHQADISARL